MKLNSAFIVSLTGVVLAGCQTSDALVGSGPITLSSQAESNFQRYLDTGGPSFFVVSLDGRYSGYSYCPTGSSSGCRRDIVVFEVLDRCEKRAGQKCYIYAEEEFVVWKKNEPRPATAASTTSTAARTTTNLTNTGTLSDLSNKALCTLALSKTVSDKWSLLPGNERYVAEARKRKLDPSLCATTDGVATPYAVRGTGGLMRRGVNMTDAQLCSRILDENARAFYSVPNLRGHVREAKYRNLTPAKCAEISTIETERKLAMAAPVSTGAEVTIANMSDTEVCREAVAFSGDTPSWTRVQRNLGYMYAAMGRGFSPDTCAALLRS